MPFHIKVSNSENRTSWEKPLTPEEYKTVKTYISSSKTVSILPATLKPVRTNNFKNFSKDFFLPTLVNHALKVQNATKRNFAILGSLVLDTMTFPIRFLSGLVVCASKIGSKKPPQNLLKKYLIEQNVNAKLLESDHVSIRLEWETTSSFPTSIWTTKDGVQHQKFSQEKHYLEQNVNFIKVPTYSGCDHFVDGMTS